MAGVPAEDKLFFVTRESQEAAAGSSRKESYAGLRDLTDLEKIKEMDIVGPDGTIRGIKNRVRAGLATYENHGALVKKNTEEGKIIVYTTSFRGVRQTYEECRYILTVFHNLRVRVHERDIYVHKFYHRELEERLDSPEDTEQLPVPQVYINGQHIGGKADVEMLNESGELRTLVANLPRQDTLVKCSTCGGFEFILCRKCGGSKNSVANNFTSEFRALRCTHCNENGMEPCPICEEKKSLTLEEKKAIEASKKEKALQKQLEKEKREKEKREQIMREALEAEREKQLEKERIRKEKEKKKERARLEKERRKRATEIRQKVVAEIAKELEREKQWQAEHEVDDNHDSENLSVTVESPQVIQGGEECLQNDSDEVEDSPEETECAAVEDSPEETKCAAVEDSPEGTKCALVDTETKETREPFRKDGDVESTLEQETVITELNYNETETLF